MRKVVLAAGALAILVAILMVACSSHGGATPCGFGCGAEGGMDGGGSDTPLLSDGQMLGGDHGAPTNLVIQPADSTLNVPDLMNLPTAQLTAVVTFGDGTMGTASASWTIDRLDIASIGAGNGVVTPTAMVFGKAIVTAQVLGKTATTSITIATQTTVNLGNIPAGDAMQLAGTTTPDPAVQFLDYPYDKTVFPRGTVPPEMMWSLSSAGDEYLVHYVSPGFDLSVLTTADPPSRFTLPQALWNTFASSAAGNDATIELRRFSAGVAYLSAKQTWHIADANLRGLVYYWDISQGQVLKADLSIGQVSPVFASGSSTDICGSAPCGSGNPRALNAGLPLTPPWEDNGLGNRCVACHSVSKDGSTMAGVFSRSASQGPLGFVNLSSTLINAIGDYTVNGMMTAITPDGTLAVMNTADKHLQLLDTSTGMPIPSALDPTPDGGGPAYLCDPVFSPDGKSLAVAGNCVGGTNFVLEFSQSDLVLYDFTESSRTFANLRTILPSGSGAGAAMAFPSFSPNSSWIFFQGGDYSRAKYGGSFQHGNDDLYVVSATQSGAVPIPLGAANGASVLPPNELHLNYAPTVNPVVSGGYIWVVFTSPRDYGNRMVAPVPPQPMTANDVTYANHKQLWVAAIDANIGSTDPSHPAFWLPGQDPTSANMFGYWTLAPCKPTQGPGGPPTCATGFECCSGFCRDTGTGAVCVDNAGGCHQLGEVCTMDSDCCNAGPAVGCVAGICQTLGTK